MGLADRFVNNLIDERECLPLNKPALADENPFVLENSVLEKQSRFNSLKDELFEKIVSIPCWAEYDFNTQYDLIVKFLHSKNVKTPEIFAKVLQHSILGFGVFDEYLLKKGVTALFYEEGEPILYTQGDKNVVDNMILPMGKVRLAVQNIINMSQYSVKNGAYDFRISEYWVQLRAFPGSKIKLSISRIDDDFLLNEMESANLSLLLSDF